MSKIIKTIVILAVTGLVLTGLGASSDDYRSFINQFTVNQRKIKTLIASGSLNIIVKNTDGKIVSQTNDLLKVTIKGRDMGRVELQSGKQPIVIVQKSKMLRQKVGSNYPLTTGPAESGRLFRQYLDPRIVENISNLSIIRFEKLTDNGRTLYHFQIKIKQAQIMEFKNQKFIITPEIMEIYFDASGNVVKNIITDKKSRVLTSAEADYVQQKGIFIVKKMRVTTNSGSLTTENIILYDTVGVNVTVPDNIFELR